MSRSESSIFENFSCINGVNTTNIDTMSNISTIYMYPAGTFPIRNGIPNDEDVNKLLLLSTVKGAKGKRKVKLSDPKRYKDLSIYDVPIEVRDNTLVTSQYTQDQDETYNEEEENYYSFNYSKSPSSIFSSEFVPKSSKKSLYKETTTEQSLPQSIMNSVKKFVNSYVGPSSPTNLYQKDEPTPIPFQLNTTTTHKRHTNFNFPSNYPITSPYMNVANQNRNN